MTLTLKNILIAGSIALLVAGTSGCKRIDGSAGAPGVASGADASGSSGASQ